MLKKAIAILLLVVYLFNLAGYTLVFKYFIHHSDTGFISLLDQKKYNDAELVQISIPLHLPYVNNSSFERIDGTVENDGIQYNYVKRRVHNDTLYIMCLPNHQKSLLVKGKTSFAGAANDFGAGKKEKESNAKKAGFAPEYNNTFPGYAVLSPGTAKNSTAPSRAAVLLNRATGTAEHPPEFSC